MKDFSLILKQLKEASPFDIFLISFIALPFVLSSWLTIFEALECPTAKLVYLLGGVVLIYLLGIVTMVWGMTNQDKQELAKDQILGYLQRKGFRMMSFDRIRENINSSYKDSFLSSVIQSYPNDLRRATLKGGKKGVARIIVETDEEDEA